MERPVPMDRMVSGDVGYGVLGTDVGVPGDGAGPSRFTSNEQAAQTVRVWRTAVWTS
jgi:hypothetical protein